MTAYPSDYPQPLLSGFSGSVKMGVIRADGATDQAQRRVQMTMGHVFTLNFIMSTVQWAAWRSWVATNGHRWFYMNLPTIYAGLAETELSSVLIRLTSGVSSVPVSGSDFQISVTAETAPSMISQYLAAAKSPTFPADLPAPLIDGYGNNSNIGLSSVQFERGNTRQRKTAKADRENFSLSFKFTTAQWWAWLSWVNQYGYDWHNLDLASSYSGLSISGGILIPHTVRYTSDISFELVAPGIFRVSAEAEMDVSTTPDGALPPSGIWYVAGTPASPATDTITAGTPASPAPDFAIAGSPALPAA